MITFMYFDGCPHAAATLENLRRAARELDIADAKIEVVEVDGIDTAARLRFPGSPTILVDGIDIVTGEEPTDFSFACRTFEFDGKQTGVIPEASIRDRLREYAGRG